jgi:two-component system, cell cycle response regulator DivK
MQKEPVVVLLVQSSRDDSGVMYAEFLHFHGLTPIVVSNAAEAFDAAAHVDIVVTSMALSGDADGLDLIARLRSYAPTEHMPIIVLTACAWKAAHDRAVRAGCNAFLTKPCLPEALLLEVRRQLASRNLPRSRATPAKADIADAEVRPRRSGSHTG